MDQRPQIHIILPILIVYVKFQFIIELQYIHVLTLWHKTTVMCNCVHGFNIPRLFITDILNYVMLCLLLKKMKLNCYFYMCIYIYKLFIFLLFIYIIHMFVCMYMYVYIRSQHSKTILNYCNLIIYKGCIFQCCKTILNTIKKILFFVGFRDDWDYITIYISNYNCYKLLCNQLLFHEVWYIFIDS